jgi:hypothetical protein
MKEITETQYKNESKLNDKGFRDKNDGTVNKHLKE